MDNVNISTMPSGIHCGVNCQGMPTDHGIKELPDLVNQLQPIQRIFKVPNHVKQSNLEAYQPKLVSIGPYHFGELQLQPMETHKRRAQDIFVERSKLTINYYKVEMKEVLDTLKESYADLDHVLWSHEDKFINQIILDGCFLIAFLCEPLSFFKQHAIDHDVLMQDLVMVDNQLPYFALEKLLTTSGKMLNPRKVTLEAHRTIPILRTKSAKSLPRSPLAYVSDLSRLTLVGIKWN